MKKFYRQVSIPNFDIIKQELLAHIGKQYLEKKSTHSWIGDLISIYRDCPTFRDFILKNTKKPIRQIKFYCTPPNNSLSPHVDGAKNLRLPFGLNIPLLGTEGTHHYWYDCPPENTILRPVDKSNTYTNNYLSDVEVPRDAAGMPIIEKLELLSPCVTKTDIMHGVENPTENIRLIAVVRWSLDRLDYSELEDVFDTSKIVIDPL